MGDHQGDLKRTLSGIASAAIVLGAISPMAFAATSSSSGLTPAGQLPIVVNGQVLSNPYEMVGIDSGNQTGFFPIYYFDQALAKIGIQATWNGSTHTWALADANVNAANVQVAGGVGTGNTTVTLNGTTIKMFNTQVAKDPAGGPKGQVTTYMPIYYIDNILQALGINGTFSGQTGLNITTAQNTSGSSLSAISVSGGTGTGTSTNPAVAMNNQTLTLSTTLTDANGNPIPNTAVQFQFSEYRNAPSVLPTVMNSSGTVISGTANSSYEAYTVYTNSQGVATIQVQGPAGQTYAYEVIATAPYESSSNNTAVTSQPAYVTFVGNDEAAITPYAGSGQPFGATMGTPVPITVVVPPNSAGQAQANVLVTLTATGGAFFTNSSGQDLGQSIQVTTNSSGIAQAWLNDSNNETVEVSATMPAGLDINNPNPTYIYFAPSGTASNIANYSISSTSVQAGQYVTVSGQLVNAAGNPIANGQILVVGNDTTNSGDFGYVTTSNGQSTITDFPDVGMPTNGVIPVAEGTPANSGTGLLITADSEGNFSFQVTDTSDDSTATFSIYPVSNGVVTSSTPLKSGTITFATSTTLEYISVAGSDTTAQANTYTSMTGLSAPNHSDAGAIFVDPQNAAGDPLMQQNLTYTLTVSNGGTVAAITSANGQTILPINPSNPGLSSVTLQETYNASTNTYTLSVPGQSGSITQTDNPDFGVVVYNSNTGSTTLTIQSGGVTATAQYTFTGGQPTYVQNLSPATATMTPGAQQTLTFTVQDDQGNPVSNAEVPLYLAQNASSPLAWITQVNGVALDQTENMGTLDQASYANEPTPIPVGETPAGLGYSTVNLSGVVAWNAAQPNVLDVYTNSNGQVSLTLSNGTTYYVAPSGNNAGTLASASPTTSGTLSFWTWPAKGDSATAQYALVIE
ncbi:MAG: hypothetical protein K6T30_06230 [Alicyclobacillus sp.]|nr:hypothetical protein [Alicyclobacillus sp.]